MLSFQELDLKTLKFVDYSDMTDVKKPDGLSTDLPTWEEACEYARRNTLNIIFSKAKHMPEEHRQEVLQNSLIRTWKAFQNFRKGEGWRSLVYMHCKGALADYLKSGDGFQERKDRGKKDRAKLQEKLDRFKVAHDNSELSFLFASEKHFFESKQELKGAMTEIELELSEMKPQLPRLKFRVEASYFEDDGEQTFDEIAARHGAVTLPDTEKERDINWELIGHLANGDKELHAFVMNLLGYTFDQMETVFDLSAQRIHGMATNFQKKLACQVGKEAMAKLYTERFKQTLYALGMSEHFGLQHKDNGFGWDLKKIDLNSLDPLEAEIDRNEKQMDLFG